MAHIKFLYYDPLVEPITSLFAENLKKLRKERGLSQDELAELIDVDPKTILNYENKKRWPQPEIVRALARALMVTEARLFYDSGLIVKPSPQECLRIVLEAMGVENVDKIRIKPKQLTTSIQPVITGEAAATDELEKATAILRRFDRPNLLAFISTWEHVLDTDPKNRSRPK